MRPCEPSSGLPATNSSTSCLKLERSLHTSPTGSLIERTGSVARSFLQDERWPSTSVRSSGSLLKRLVSFGRVRSNGLPLGDQGEYDLSQCLRQSDRPDPTVGERA